MWASHRRCRIFGCVGYASRKMIRVDGGCSHPTVKSGLPHTLWVLTKARTREWCHGDFVLMKNAR